MKIVQLSTWSTPIPPVKYGGIELVVYNLTEELVKMGHEVYLLAPGDSKTSAKLLPCSDLSLLKQYANKENRIKFWTELYPLRYISKAIENINKVKPDIVHNHLGWMFLPFESLITYPLVTTEHWSTNDDGHKSVDLLYKNSNFIAISNHQRSLLKDINWIGTVYNGIDIDKYKYNGNKQDYFAYLGRTSKSKGLKEICETVKKTNYKLKIGAFIEPGQEKYFEEEIMPLIDGEKIQYLGELDHKSKVDLLKNAKALLSWLKWDEPFGLVTVEANACGTPVIVNRKGAMEEIIIDKFNGFLVNTFDEMIDKMGKTDEISPLNCRQVVEKKFSSKQMAEGYLDLYSKILA